MKFLKRETRLIACMIGAGYGLRTTLDLFGFTDYGRQPVVALVVGIVQIIAVILLLMIAFTDAKDLKKPRTPVVGATSKTFADFPIITSEHVPRGQFVMVNPDDLQKIIRATTNIGKPDFSGLIPRPYQEFGGPRPSPFLVRICPREWDDPNGRCSNDDSGAGKHTCSQNVFKHGDRCRCDCGATAKYELASDGQSVVEKTFEDPS